MKQNNNPTPVIVTAGSTYLDVDAYACAVALAELLELQGVRAYAYSTAPANYSVTPTLAKDSPILRALPDGLSEATARYIIVDVSDPEYVKDSVPLDRVTEVFDHHVGFESYWQERIGESARIEFIGAAATLIYREWRTYGMEGRMSPATARLLIAAILDNTLNLTSSNTTEEDRETFAALRRLAGVTPDWCAAYFTEVQNAVEQDLPHALLGDLKTLRNTEALPPRIAQLCVWDADRIVRRLPEIRALLEGDGSWLLNVIDLQENCSRFVCDDPLYQGKLETVFGVTFEAGVARSPVSYLRKQIIKKACFSDPRP